MKNYTKQVKDLLWQIVVMGEDVGGTIVSNQIEAISEESGSNYHDINNFLLTWLSHVQVKDVLLCKNCEEKEGCDQVKSSCALFNPEAYIFTDQVWETCTRGMEKLQKYNFISESVFYSQLGAVPPKLYQNNMFQCGEPYSSNKNGAFTYFSAIYNKNIKLWQFVGYLSTKDFKELYKNI